MKKDYLLKRVFKFDGVTSLRTLVIEWPVYDKLGEAIHDAFGNPVTRDVGFVGKDAADILEYRNASHAYTGSSSAARWRTPAAWGIL